MALPVICVLLAHEIEGGVADAVVEVDLEAVQRDPLAWRLLQLVITVDWERRSATLMPESELCTKPFVRTADLAGLLDLGRRSVVARGWNLRQLRRQAAAETIHREMDIAPPRRDTLGPDPGTGTDPYFISATCSKCSTRLVPAHASGRLAVWSDEWLCPNCADDSIILDWPPDALQALRDAVAEAESEEMLRDRS